VAPRLEDQHGQPSDGERAGKQGRQIENQFGVEHRGGRKALVRDVAGEHEGGAYRHHENQERPGDGKGKATA